jgi:hypothetical protein
MAKMAAQVEEARQQWRGVRKEVALLDKDLMAGIVSFQYLAAAAERVK